jgi:hypothetical protein
MPTLPNFVHIEELERHVDVALLSDQMLEQVGAEWTQRLIEHARKRRKKK